MKHTFIRSVPYIRVFSVFCLHTYARVDGYKNMFFGITTETDLDLVIHNRMHPNPGSACIVKYNLPSGRDNSAKAYSKTTHTTRYNTHLSLNYYPKVATFTQQ